MPPSSRQSEVVSAPARRSSGRTTASGRTVAPRPSGRSSARSSGRSSVRGREREGEEGSRTETPAGHGKTILFVILGVLLLAGAAVVWPPLERSLRLADLRGKDEKRREAAAATLARHGEAVRPVLEAGLEGQGALWSDPSRAAAAGALARMKNPGADRTLDRLARGGKGDEAERLRGWALRGIAAAGAQDRFSPDLWILAAGSPDAELRALAAAELGRSADRRALPLLLRLIADPLPAVSTRATESAAARLKPADAPLLLPLLDKPDPAPAAAIRLLAGIPGKESAEAVASRLADAPAALATQLLDLLAAMPAGSGAEPVLLRCTEEGAPALRAKALEAAARLRLSAVAARLPAAVADPDPAVRLAAARAGAHLGGSASSGVVRPLLKDPDARVREAALVCVLRSPDAAAAEDAIALLSDPEEAVRKVAAAALAERFPSHASFGARAEAWANWYTGLRGQIEGIDRFQKRLAEVEDCFDGTDAGLDRARAIIEPTLKEMDAFWKPAVLAEEIRREGSPERKRFDAVRATLQLRLHKTMKNRTAK